MAFFLWSIISIGFVILGIVCFCSKGEKAFGFWANEEVFKVNNVKAYNKALGKLWVVYGIALEFMGVPLLQEQNSSEIIFTVIGVMFLTIALMIVYSIVIEPKYKVD